MKNKVFECINPECEIYKKDMLFKHKSCNSCPFIIENMPTVKSDFGYETTISQINNSSEHSMSTKYNLSTVNNYSNHNKFIPTKILSENYTLMLEDKNRILFKIKYFFSNILYKLKNPQTATIVILSFIIILLFIKIFTADYKNDTNKKDSAVSNTTKVVSTIRTDAISNGSLAHKTVIQNLYDFEDSTNNWKTEGISEQLTNSTDWSFSGAKSLKLEFNRSPNVFYTAGIDSKFDFSNKIMMKAFLNNKSADQNPDSIQANLFIKVGNQLTQYQSVPTKINVVDKFTLLNLSFAGINELNNIQAIGVQFNVSADSVGKTRLYIDHITVE